MNTTDILYLAWPYIGLGGGIAVIVGLFTDAFRSTPNVSRWRDTVWLSWAMVAAYLLHVCEEYGLHITDGQFDLITNFKAMGVDERFGGIPLAFFPLVNIGLTWIALPVAAIVCRRNPVVGLAGMGFLVVNGLTHLGAGVAMGQGLAGNLGGFTGLFVFIPLFCWICYVCVKDRLLPRKGLAIAIISGVVAHLLLFSLYALNKIAGHTAAYIWTPFVVTSTLWLSWLLCKAFKVGK